jgi:hypothetical protein
VVAGPQGQENSTRLGERITRMGLAFDWGMGLRRAMKDFAAVLRSSGLLGAIHRFRRENNGRRRDHDRYAES